MRPEILEIKDEIDAMSYPQLLDIRIKKLNIFSVFKTKLPEELMEETTSPMNRYFDSRLNLKRFEYLVVPDGPLDITESK